MRRILVSLALLFALTGGALAIVYPSPAQAGSTELLLRSELVRPNDGQPDNDHTPIYGSDGRLLYPVYYQQRPFVARAAGSGGSDLPCGLPMPVADGRYGDLQRTDNWARVSVAACDGKLAGVAWSAWPGRDPIHTGHDYQDLWIEAKVTNITTGEIEGRLDLHISNNPREQGVLFHIYEFEMPANGHQYMLWMWARMRHQRCGNGSGEAEGEIKAVAPPAKREAVNGVLKIDQDQRSLAGARFELRNLPEFVRITEANLISGTDGKVWARVKWSGGPNQVEGEFCEVEPPPGFALPGQPCVNIWFVSGILAFPEDPTRIVNVPTSVPVCESLLLSKPAKRRIPESGMIIDVVVKSVNSELYRLVRLDADGLEVVGGPQIEDRFEGILVFPDLVYQVQVWRAGFDWTSTGCKFSYRREVNTSGTAICVQTSTQTAEGHALVNVRAIDQASRPVPIDAWKAESNFGFGYERPRDPDLLPVLVKFPDKLGTYWVQFSVLLGELWLGGGACRIENRIEMPEQYPNGQYQDFVGSVVFGTFTPYLEAGKEYFDGARSLMYNVEYINSLGQGDIVFRFNGQEVSEVTTSIFNAGTFGQMKSVAGRAITTFSQGVTKLIAYRHGIEQARIFQAVPEGGARWIHPLDQPFEHKYGFDLEIHGPPGATDVLIYYDYQSEVTYSDDGRAEIHLSFTKPGLVSIYEKVEGLNDLKWVTVDLITSPITASQNIYYSFEEVALDSYRIVDSSDQVVVGPSSSHNLNFVAYPGVTYEAQLAYPDTSLFVGLYDDMKFKYPSYWVMPLDAANEHVHEFHLDYWRDGQGEVIVDQLYLLNSGISAAQAFPYGRHDAVLPGVKIVGVPDVNVVAFCQPPGAHAVAYWGDWEAGSYTLQERYIVFDRELYNEWNEGQRNDCFDAAYRVNMELARQGLRTDHTHRHHGERSQGFQMTQLHIWSPYNLVGMRPPHVGRILKPGTLLPYYVVAEDLLFWGWDLERGALIDGLGAAALQQYVDSLGPIEYIDQRRGHNSGT